MTPPSALLTPPQTGNETELRTAVAKAPKDAAAITRLGDYYTTQKLFAKAIDQYKTATVADPRYAPAFSALGEAYVVTIPSTKTQLPPEARAAFLSAVAIDPDDLRSRFYLAMEKDFMGQHDQAINDWIRMLGMVPMGSKADEAIRATIIASMGRSATIIRRRVNDATRIQPKPSVTPAQMK